MSDVGSPELTHSVLTGSVSFPDETSEYFNESSAFSELIKA